VQPSSNVAQVMDNSINHAANYFSADRRPIELIRMNAEGMSAGYLLMHPMEVLAAVYEVKLSAQVVDAMEPLFGTLMFFGTSMNPDSYRALVGEVYMGTAVEMGTHGAECRGRSLRLWREATAFYGARHGLACSGTDDEDSDLDVDPFHDSSTTFDLRGEEGVHMEHT
jgi:hypothetical protein